MSKVKRGGIARPCAKCLMKENRTHLLETADKTGGAEMDPKYSPS